MMRRRLIPRPLRSEEEAARYFNSDIAEADARSLRAEQVLLQHFLARATFYQRRARCLFVDDGVMTTDHEWAEQRIWKITAALSTRRRAA